ILAPCFMASRFSFLHPTGRESCSANCSASRFWFRALRPGPPCIWSESRLTIRQRWTIRGGRQNFGPRDRKSTRLNSSHVEISYAVVCLKKKKKRNSTSFILKKKKIMKQLK